MEESSIGHVENIKSIEGVKIIIVKKRLTLNMDGVGSMIFARVFNRKFILWSLGLITCYLPNR